MEQSESLVDKMRPLQILFNRRQAGEKLTEEENAILDAGFPVQQARNELIKALDEHDAKTYFTPSIDEIRVGYECRIVNTYFLANEWGQEHTLSPLKVLTREDVARLFTTSWVVRVPYLTKEQIEAEGWKHTYDFDRHIMGEIAFDKGGTSYYGPYRVVVVYHLDAHHLRIYFETLSRRKYVRFSGDCNDINTFRYICKLLNIK